MTDALDIDAIRDAIMSMTADPIYNLDGLGGDIPVEADFLFLIEGIIGTAQGNADLNKTINFNDFVGLSCNFGMTGSMWHKGNFNLDDVINFNDFVAFSNHFTLTFPSLSVDTVPEPATRSPILAWVLWRREFRV